MHRVERVEPLQRAARRAQPSGIPVGLPQRAATSGVVSARFAVTYLRVIRSGSMRERPGGAPGVQLREHRQMQPRVGAGEELALELARVALQLDRVAVGVREREGDRDLVDAGAGGRGQLGG